MALAELALLLADGRMPNGGHAHSGGLEAAVKTGACADDVPAFMRGRLLTCGFVEAAIAAAASRAAAASDHEQLERLDREALARISGPSLRKASATLGRSLLRSASRVLGEPAVLESYRRQSAATPRAVALGVVAAAAGLRPVEAATISLHDDLTAVASAAVKLLPLDAATSLSWVAELAPELERCARLASEPIPIEQLPSISATGVELRSLRHASDEGRLFAT
jgi:urease accessory protein